MKRTHVLAGLLALLLSSFLATTFAEQAKDPLLDAMNAELNRSFAALKTAEPAPLYFLQYSVVDIAEVIVNASFGAITSEHQDHDRWLKADARVGSAELDNTHELREGRFGGFDAGDYMPMERRAPLESDQDALKAEFWAATDNAFKTAQERFIKVKTNKAVKVAEEDASADFSIGEPQTYLGELTTMAPPLDAWRARVKSLSSLFKAYPWITESYVTITGELTTRYLVNSEGTMIREQTPHYRLGAYAETTAEDGMNLYLFEPYDSASLDSLAKDEEVIKGINKLIENLDKLRTAPLIEPFTGPAILKNKASGVFFHEIFGHRIEGHRQKSEQEGQTFTKKVGQVVLPEFISVYDDPTMAKLNNQDLNGYYRYDDEGTPAQRVAVVEKGVLRNFLMSRSPIAGFTKSNGHARREHVRRIVARQGNLLVQAAKSVSFDDLRKQLIQECKKQQKPYGLMFEDLSGGFTSTQRAHAQVFKVVPLLVKKIYADGRPDEVVRGVDIVGTPLLAFSKIIAAANDTDVFNGHCGAESGWVPVGAISPSILVAEIEVEKKFKDQDKPPILPPPGQSK